MFNFWMSDTSDKVLRIHKVHPDVKLPVPQTKGAACFDLAFCSAGKSEIKAYAPDNNEMSFELVDTQLFIPPAYRVMVPTGLIFDIPDGYSVRLHARSGLSLKKGLTLINGEGVVDSDYVDEIFLLVVNMSGATVSVDEGERICQAELIRNLNCSFRILKDKPRQKGDRTGGFGSTGTS